MSAKQTVILGWMVSGAALAIVQWMIWKEINNRLPPQQQIRKQVFNDMFIWFRADGLLTQHARLYPDSRLTTVFKVLWGTFWVLLAFWYAAR
jgi:hypothetical protein